MEAHNQKTKTKMTSEGSCRKETIENQQNPKQK